MRTLTPRILGEILPRRKRERDLFFDAKWSGDGTMAVYDVSKPGYRPVRPKRSTIAPLLATQPTPDIAEASNPPSAPPASASPETDGRNWFERLFD